MKNDGQEVKNAWNGAAAMAQKIALDKKASHDAKTLAGYVLYIVSTQRDS